MERAEKDSECGDFVENMKNGVQVEASENGICQE
jgi:hypothetical protein